MAYIEPKINWNEEYEPSTQDMNRIEGNIKHVKEDIGAIEARSITAGDGLSGGGTLAGSRTIDVDSTVVRTSRTITAGDGLSGGGSLAEDRTIDVDSTVFRYRGYTTHEVSSPSNYTLPAISVGEIRRYQITNTGGSAIAVSLPAGDLFLATTIEGVMASEFNKLTMFIAGDEELGSIGAGFTLTFHYWRLA